MAAAGLEPAAGGIRLVVGTWQASAQAGWWAFLSGALRELDSRGGKGGPWVVFREFVGETHMAAPQLRLIGAKQTHAGSIEQLTGSTDPTQRIFGHWLVMLGRSAAQCKLGPTRRRAIDAALTLYDEDTLCLAIEGVACPMPDCPEGAREAMRALVWLFSTEDRVERFAAVGRALRAHAHRREQARQERLGDGSMNGADPAAAQAARQRLAAMAAAMRSQSEHG